MSSIQRVTGQKRTELALEESVTSLYQTSAEYTETMDQIADIIAHN